MKKRKWEKKNKLTYQEKNQNKECASGWKLIFKQNDKNKQKRLNLFLKITQKL